jgi:trans-aconitate methyltransferase
MCKNLLETIKEPHIMSFGCSTGEEVNSIRSYVSNAHLYGVDINNYCLRIARKKFKHKNNIFTHPNSLIYKGINQLDAVFCLAIFQDSRNRHDAQILRSKQYLFNQFQSQLINLDSKLKIGGILFIDHCDFNFLETTTSLKYKILDINNNQITRKRPLFNMNNEKVSNQSTLFRIFIKIK